MPVWRYINIIGVRTVFFYLTCEKSYIVNQDLGVRCLFYACLDFHARISWRLLKASIQSLLYALLPKRGVSNQWSADLVATHTWLNTFVYGLMLGEKKHPKLYSLHLDGWMDGWKEGKKQSISIIGRLSWPKSTDEGLDVVLGHCTVAAHCSLEGYGSNAERKNHYTSCICDQ